MDSGLRAVCAAPAPGGAGAALGGQRPDAGPAAGTATRPRPAAVADPAGQAAAAADPDSGQRVGGQQGRVAGNRHGGAVRDQRGRAVRLDGRRRGLCHHLGGAARHVEQKNWTHVRQCFGYARYDQPELVEPINALVKGAYGQLLNYFHASLKLEGKERHDGKVRRVYGPAQTPVARVLASAQVDEATKQRLRQDKARLNPFALKRAVEQSLKQIEAMRRRTN